MKKLYFLSSIVREMRNYQYQAMRLAVYDERAKLSYPIMGLVSEVGELADLMKRAIRDNDGILSEEKNLKMRNELGDCLWYLTAVAHDLGTDLGSVAEDNLIKLFERREAGTLRTREGR